MTLARISFLLIFMILVGACDSRSPRFEFGVVRAEIDIFELVSQARSISEMLGV